MTNKIKRIMLVDDEPDMTYIVSAILSQAGFEMSVNKPREAIPALLISDHAMLILDLMMPDMDGFQVLTKIRKEERLSKLPVLILSCRTLSHDETALLASLKAEVMAKPFEPHRLIEKVREMALE